MFSSVGRRKAGKTEQPESKVLKCGHESLEELIFLV